MSNKLLEKMIEAYEYAETNKEGLENIYQLTEDVSCKFDEWREDNYIGGRDKNGMLSEGTWHTYSDHTKMLINDEFQPPLKTTKELFNYFINNVYNK